MARCLIIGCGCRGQALAGALAQDGRPVRATTRDPARVPAIEAAGAEAVVADPDRVGTLIQALDQVTVVVLLMGSATGSPAQIEALHGTRLEMLLTKLVDTTVRGVVYEARGTAPDIVLRAGARRVEEFGRTTRARYELLEADPADPERWVAAASAAVERCLVPRVSGL